MNNVEYMDNHDDMLHLNALARHFQVKFTVTGFFLGKLDRYAFTSVDKSKPICRGLSIFVILTKGSVRLVADGRSDKVVASGANLAFIRPHSTLNSMQPSHDCDGVLIASNDFFMVANMTFIKFRPDLPSDFMLGSGASMFSIEKDKIESLSWNFMRFVANMRDKDHLYWGEKLRLNSIEIYLEIFDIINRDVKMRNIKEESRAGDIFKRFFMSVNRNVTTRREVGYYAEELCITPKYLNIVCKKMVNKNASSVIDDVAVMAASGLLRDFSLSVGQIAGMLNFKGQAAFTKFFKKMTGLTPTQFRYEY